MVTVFVVHRCVFILRLRVLRLLCFCQLSGKYPLVNADNHAKIIVLKK